MENIKNEDVEITTSTEIIDTGIEMMKILPPVMHIVAFVSLCMGLFKLFVYNSPEGYGEAINAYVGGDAYNYQINMSMATAYFVLFGALMIGGVLVSMLRIAKSK